MKSFETLATNPILPAMQAASRENNIEFTDDTSGRFHANNLGGIYTSELQLLDTNSAKYKAAVALAQIGDQKASTHGVKQMVERISETGRRLYSKLENEFGLKAAALLVFFPEGLTGVSKARRGDYITIINNWINKANKTEYKPKLGQAWLDELDKLKGDWEAAIGVQSGEKEEVDHAAGDAEAVLVDVAQNLWNLLLLVIQNNQPHAEKVVGAYFDTTPLQRREHHDRDGLGRTFGLVKDAAGVGMPEVHITVKDADGQIKWQGKTNGEGKWRTKNIHVGLYHLTFEKPGYVTQVISHEFLDAHETEVNVEMIAG